MAGRGRAIRRLRLRRRPAIWTAAAVLAASTPAAAEPVRLVTGDGYPPFSDRDWLNGGLVTDVVRQVYDTLGQDVDLRFLPWVRGYRETLAGRFRATFPYIHNAERAKEFHYSDSIIDAEKRPMTLADSAVRADSVDDLKGLTYCMPHGYPPQAAIARLTEAGALRRLDPPSMRACVKTLARGLADFIPVPTFQGRAVAERVLGEGRRVRFLDIVLQENGQHVIFPRGQPGAERARDRFDAGLARLKRSGRFDAIVAQHLRRLRDVAPSSVRGLPGQPRKTGQPRKSRDPEGPGS